MKYIDTNNGGIKSWCSNIEDNALVQAVNLTKLPFTFRHVALMPDCHTGYGMPIGGVLATKNVIIPNAVGVDIGCGVQAQRTDLTDLDTNTLKSIMSKIRDKIPVGFKHHKERQEWCGFDDAPDISIIQKELNSSQHQLGTLGGGNHFIEIQGGDDGYIWVILHSGSRNFGYKIANEYHKIAKNLCEMWHSNIPDKDLSFLPIDTKLGEEYKEAMDYALLFAHENRNRMMDLIKESIAEVLVCDFDKDDNYDVHHNYAIMEHHYGKNVMLHRKGAICVREKMVGIIPGSQGTCSYIVTGKGDKESYNSCSHGAGRRMGRKQACRELNLDEEIKRLDDRGIVHSIRRVEDLDEAPSAYKDIGEVMESQKDLVDIKVKLSPLGVIKG